MSWYLQCRFFCHSLSFCRVDKLYHSVYSSWTFQNSRGKSCEIHGNNLISITPKGEGLHSKWGMVPSRWTSLKIFLQYPSIELMREAKEVFQLCLGARQDLIFFHATSMLFCPRAATTIQLYFLIHQHDFRLWYLQLFI